MSPAGSTVLITRSHEVAGKFLRELASLSRAHQMEIEPLCAPIHEAELALQAPTEFKALAHENFRWVTFTSVNGVLACQSILNQPLSEFLAPFKVACVGKATAHALETRGVRIDFIPSVFDAVHMVSEFPESAGDYKRPAVLCVQGTNARATLTEGLSAAGWHVTTWNVYTMSAYPAQNPLKVHKPETEGTNLTVEQAVTELSSVAAVVATAPSLLTDLYENWQAAQLIPQAEFPLVVAIGATTATTAQELGLRAVQSPSPSPYDLAQTTLYSIEKKKAYS